MDFSRSLAPPLCEPSNTGLAAVLGGVALDCVRRALVVHEVDDGVFLLRLGLVGGEAIALPPPPPLPPLPEMPPAVAALAEDARGTQAAQVAEFTAVVEACVFDLLREGRRHQGGDPYGPNSYTEWLAVMHDVHPGLLVGATLVRAQRCVSFTRGVWRWLRDEIFPRSSDVRAAARALSNTLDWDVVTVVATLDPATPAPRCAPAKRRVLCVTHHDERVSFAELPTLLDGARKRSLVEALWSVVNVSNFIKSRLLSGAALPEATGEAEHGWVSARRTTTSASAATLLGRALALAPALYEEFVRARRLVRDAL